MGRREGDSRGAVNTGERSELGCLQDSPRLGGRHPCRLEVADMDAASRPPMEMKKHQHKHNLKHRYELMETLGKGAYGKVKKAVERVSLKTVAIKSIRKEHITDDLDRIHIQREIDITSSLRHPNIIHFHEVFESRDKIVIVMEYASKGELYDYILEKRKLSETEARSIFRQITSAVHYCHKNGVVHRDLKLENILLDADLTVKVDCWALGVLLYVLVYSSMPFDGISHSVLTEQICQGHYRRPNLPSDACALIDWLLTVRVDERATIEDVANHWWVNWGYEESVCDCTSSAHPDCPSPLLARYIDWQSRAVNSMPADPGCLSLEFTRCPPHARYFSLPLRSERGGGGGGGARVRGGTVSVRKSRKENAIPQTAQGPCGSTAASCSISTVERKKPKSILKPQKSFDFFMQSTPKESPHLFYQTHALAHSHADVLSTSTFSQPSSKMTKKGILKNLYEGASGYDSSKAGVKDSDVGDLCANQQPTCVQAADDSPTLRTEAVRRRKGILKRNGKFSQSLDLPDAHLSLPSSDQATFPEALQQFFQDNVGAEGHQNRPSSVVSEDSLFSCDSFDLLDLSAQSRRRFFLQGMHHSTCKSEEDLRAGAGENEGQASKW
ncbi:NUAK family SNF1-like kinase 1 isoform X2 [Dunckerocampus dactyliophorus]|uniref:NUAK family SNF1-like kinase 1 isoform X2 n=1 Tax=Dunckerocampus dactyliophorus TaxID=161453 RepID=UPI0024069652|nr:NUAK family SNF1-like kinase 1 isoform X2 [Dunckerocampus dactyliophorus]